MRKCLAISDKPASHTPTLTPQSLPHGTRLEQNWSVKLIPLFLLIGMLAVSGWAKDEVTYSPELVKKAESGDMDSQIKLGRCYYLGLGVAQDRKESVKWCLRAAEQGNATAQHSLGRCYLFGQGVAQDYKEAVKWWKMAAEQSFVSAQHDLGNCYYNGDGVTQDYKEAVKWYTKAAGKDYALSQYNLGECYFYGKGVTKDSEEAIKWYTKAAKQGNFEAIVALRVIKKSESK